MYRRLGMVGNTWMAFPVSLYESCCQMCTSGVGWPWVPCLGTAGLVDLQVVPTASTRPSPAEQLAMGAYMCGWPRLVAGLGLVAVP
jgi:hypothetical protein